MPFGSDSILLYDVDPWNQLGFGAPAFQAENVGTLNRAVQGLADEIGRNQLFIMTHVDAMRLQPPSRNTIERVCKMVNRVQSVLAGRQKDYPDSRVEEGHFKPSTVIWTIHPVPYFRAALVRNKWLAEYNDLVMIALTNMYQHSDNNLSLTVTAPFAKDIWQYFKEIKLRCGSELLGLKIAELAKDEFVFTPEMFDAYHPDNYVVNIEALDKPGPLFSLPTEQDLYPLLQGIPADIILPMLKPYPIGPVAGGTGRTDLPLPNAAAAVGTPGNPTGNTSPASAGANAGAAAGAPTGEIIGTPTA